MHKNDSFAAIEFLVEWREARIPEVAVLFVRVQQDPIRLKRIECKGDLLQAPLNVGQRKRREISESSRIISRDTCSEFVTIPGQQTG